MRGSDGYSQVPRGMAYPGSPRRKIQGRPDRLVVPVSQSTPPDPPNTLHFLANFLYTFKQFLRREMKLKGGVGMRWEVRGGRAVYFGWDAGSSLGSWFRLDAILRRRHPVSPCQTSVPFAILRRENDDSGLPSPRPGICGKTDHSTEREYGRLFAG